MEKRRPLVRPSLLWTLALVVSLAGRSAWAQHGGFHPNVMQQGGRSPRPMPPMSGPPAQREGARNSMFPTGPGSPGAVRNALQSGPVGRWWDDKRVARSMGLRGEQKMRMDAIFNANKAAIVSAYQNLVKAKARYDALSREPQPDKAQMFASIDAVNEARTALEKSTDTMLLAIRAELDAEQLAKLQSMR